MFRIELQHLVEVSGRPVIIVLEAVDHAAIVIGLSKFRIESDCLIQVDDRLIVIVLAGVDDGSVEVGDSNQASARLNLFVLRRPLRRRPGGDEGTGTAGAAGPLASATMRCRAFSWASRSILEDGISCRARR
jgi:hypothetical protein